MSIVVIDLARLKYRKYFIANDRGGGDKGNLSKNVIRNRSSAFSFQKARFSNATSATQNAKCTEHPVQYVAAAF